MRGAGRDYQLAAEESARQRRALSVPNPEIKSKYQIVVDGHGVVSHGNNLVHITRDFNFFKRLSNTPTNIYGGDTVSLYFKGQHLRRQHDPREAARASRTPQDQRNPFDPGPVGFGL